MAWIRTVGEGEAKGELEEVYDRIAGERGKVAEIMRVQGLHPRALAAHLDLYLALMFCPGELAREERELIAVVVSGANGCGYCLAHHLEALAHYWPGEMAQRAARDWRSLRLPQRLVRILEYAEKLTREPASVSEGDIRSLREVGLSDRGILEVNLIVGYFNFANRIALGLGIEPSPEEVSGYRY